MMLDANLMLTYTGRCWFLADVFGWMLHFVSLGGGVGWG